MPEMIFYIDRDQKKSLQFVWTKLKASFMDLDNFSRQKDFIEVRLIDGFRQDCRTTSKSVQNHRERIYITQSPKWWVVVDGVGFLWLLWLRFRTHGGVVVCKKVVMMTFDDENEVFVIFFLF